MRPATHIDLTSFDTLDTKHVDVLEKASNEGIGVRKVQARNMTIYTTSGQDKVRHTLRYLVLLTASLT